MSFGKTVIGFLVLSSAFCYLHAAYDNEIQEYQEKIDSQKKELDGLSLELAGYRSTLKKLSKKEKIIFKKIDGFDKNINVKKYEIKDLEEKLQKVSVSIIELEKDMGFNILKFAEYSDYLKESLLAYWLKKKRAYNGSIISSLLCFDLDNCYASLNTIDASSIRIEAAIGEIDRIKNLKNEMDSEKAKKLLLKKEIISVQNAFIERKKEQLLIVKEITRNRQLKEKSIKALELEQKKLKVLVLSLKKQVKSLERLKLLSDNFVKAKGQLPWPVKGTVIIKYGKRKHPELDTMIFNRGITIKTNDNSVKSVGGGEIVFADKFGDMGNMVIADHGMDYYTIYGGLSYFSVVAGQEILPMKEIGIINGRELYFEIGKGSSPEDPERWLK